MTTVLDQAASQGLADDPVGSLRRMIHGYSLSQAVYAAAKLGVADALAARPLPTEAVATAVGAHGPTLARLLRALESVGLVVTVEGDWALTVTGRLLVSDAPASLRYEAILFGEEPYRMAAELVECIRTGETAFNRVYGVGHFEYLSRSPAAAETFNRAMTQMTRTLTAQVIAAYDFSRATTVVDVGGGTGGLLAAILASTPEARGILFDLDYVIDDARRYIRTQDLENRIELLPGDAFHDAWPTGETYLMKSVLHDWDDARASQLLDRCREAIPKNGRLLVLERVLPDDGRPFWGKFVDLVMLAMSGGRERTEAEYVQLFRSARFEHMRSIVLASGFVILEARPS